MAVGASSTYRSARAARNPTGRPIAAPTTTPTANFRPASHRLNVPVRTAVTANLYATSAVASLTRLSPSPIVATRPGTPPRLAIGAAARGSVGETIAPSTNDAAQDRSTT